MSRTRKPAEVRKEELIAVTIKLCQINGIKSVTRKDIATAAGVAEALVSHHFGTMKQLQRDIVRHAIKSKDVTVTAQCVAAQYITMKEIPPGLFESVYAHLKSSTV